MRNIGKFFGLLSLLAFFTFPALAQGPSVDVFGGYEYLHWGLSSGHLNMNGGEGAATLNLIPWLGLTADISGEYNNNGANGTTHLYTYLFGPTVYPLGHHKFTPFVHGLAGYGHVNVDIPGAGTLTDSGFTYALGAGLDWKLIPHISLRLVQGDYEQTRFFSGILSGAGFSGTQKSTRIATGVVIHF
ncbi:MAG: outer membrane beta-barrel protein [Candidatus Acidiferrales bacterium]